MAAPSFQKVSQPVPKRTEPNWAVAESPCLMPSQFAADTWIEGLRVWGAEANWGAAWFDKQFKNSHPAAGVPLVARTKVLLAVDRATRPATGRATFRRGSTLAGRRSSRTIPAF